MNPVKKKTAPRHPVPFLLPVRIAAAATSGSLWQRLQSWLRRQWQTWRTKRTMFPPPLQPARHKPFPQRPHQRRRQAAFAALDAAPVGLTRRQLIAHVRLVTGLGCSEKLIAEWRKARRGDTATERDGEAGVRREEREGATERRKEAILPKRVLLQLLALGLGLLASPPPLNVSAQEVTLSPAPSAPPTFSVPPSPSPYPVMPRLLRIKLTLNAPQELQVKAGQAVEAGALLSDCQTARQRLLVQKRALVAAAQSLQRQRQLSAASLQHLQSLSLELPPTTFAAEEAAIKRAAAEAVATHRLVDIQQQKLAAVLGVGTLDLANSLPKANALIQQHEAAKLTQAQDKQSLARAEIELHKAKLTTAREARAVAEKQHRVEVTRQVLSAQSQQQQAASEAAHLTAQLAELELQLAQLAEVRAPFAGTIKRIEWEEMTDEKITVVVYLAVTQ